MKEMREKKHRSSDGQDDAFLYTSYILNAMWKKQKVEGTVLGICTATQVGSRKYVVVVVSSSSLCTLAYF